MKIFLGLQTRQKSKNGVVLITGGFFYLVEDGKKGNHGTQNKARHMMRKYSRSRVCPKREERKSKSLHSTEDVQNKTTGVIHTRFSAELRGSQVPKGMISQR